MEITNLSLIDVWKNRIKEHEGFRLEPYNLSYGNVTESFQTGGYGHRIIPGEEYQQLKKVGKLFSMQILTEHLKEQQDYARI